METLKMITFCVKPFLFAEFVKYASYHENYIMNHMTYVWPVSYVQRLQKGMPSDISEGGCRC